MQEIDTLYKFTHPNGVEVITIESIISIRTKTGGIEQPVRIELSYDDGRREVLNTDADQANKFIDYVIDAYRKQIEE